MMLNYNVECVVKCFMYTQTEEPILYIIVHIVVVYVHLLKKNLNLYSVNIIYSYVNRTFCYFMHK